MAGVATNRNVFLGKNFAGPTSKVNFFFNQPQILIPFFFTIILGSFGLDNVSSPDNI